MTIEELKVLITAETSGLKKEIKKVESELQQLNKTTQKTTKSINNSFKNLFKGVKTGAVLAALYKLGKTAINTASDLEEVQNVVEVSFGAATEEVNKFAENAIQQFGLSELSAKKFASTYMAMSNSLGVDQNIGKNMALNLTGLTGDIASFYNITAEQANTAISAIYTGETESIKKLGIVLTEANLNAYAMQQGMRKTYNQMSQAEKTMLRYNYVMQATSKVQGDFARTSGNWANQVRILKEQFSQLLGILGKGLVAVLTPLIKAVNNLLASLIAVANAIAKAFGGKGIQSASGSVSSAVGDMAGSAEDAAGGFNSANSAAKQLAKTVAGFDELNILNSSTSGGGGGGGAGGGVSGSGEIVEGPEMENPAQKMSAYLQECKAIIDKWVKTIPKLQLNFDKERAINDLKDIGQNLLNTIMGWGTFVIGITIQVANDLDVGALTNSFLGLANAASNLASKITDAVVPALWNFYNASGLKELVQWVGEKLRDSLDKAAVKLNEWAQWFVDNKEEIANFGTKLGEVVEPLTKIVKILLSISWLALSTALELIAAAVEKIGEWLVKMPIGQLKALVYTSILAVSGFKLMSFGLGLIDTSFKQVLTTAKSWGDVAFAIKEGFIMAFTHPIERVKTLITKLPPLIKGIGPTIVNGFNSVKTLSIKAFQTMSSGIIKVFTTLKAGIVTAMGAIKTAISTAIKFIIANPIALIIAAIVALVALIAVKGDEIQEILKKIGEWLKSVFVKDWTEVFGPVLGGILNKFVEFISKIVESVGKILNGIIDFIRGVFTGDWQRAWDGIKQILKGVWDGMVAVVKAPINLIIGFINKMISGAVSGINTIIKAINKLSFKAPDWVPKIGGKTWGFNIRTISGTTIPYLANGGVITQPTVAMMGEYVGANRNPEIVTPQNLLQNIVENSNNNVVDALIQQTKQLLAALENMNMNVSIGDETIAKAAQRGNLAYKRRTGRPLFT